MILLVFGILGSALVSLFFSTLTYSLRDFSRARLEGALTRHGRSAWIESTIDCSAELTYVTAVGRLIANIFIVVGCLRLVNWPRYSVLDHAMSLLLAFVVSLVFSVAVPSALARYAGEEVIALFIRPIHGLRVLLLPLVKLLSLIDALVLRLFGKRKDAEPEQIEKDILSVVEEGVEEGVVDNTERKMIESVIQFRDTEVSQTMTARPEIIALEAGADLEEVKETVERSGHSRIPVYDGTLDHIVGILYARDLTKHLGTTGEHFNIRTAMRPALFVPESKLLRDLLREFRIQKVHIAIVLDEYGGTAGLVTIEDILEELVGEISDEHEPQEAAMLKKLGENAFEADALLYISELNKAYPLNIPEDAGYDTLGGFVSTTLGRVPQKGTIFEHHQARYTILEAEPARVKRLKIELLPQVEKVQAG